MRVDHKTLLHEQNAVAHLDVLRRESEHVKKELSSNHVENSNLLRANESIRSENISITLEAQNLLGDAKQAFSKAQSLLADATKREEESHALVASTNERLNEELEKHTMRIERLTHDVAIAENELTHTKVLIETHTPVLNSILADIENHNLTVREIRAKIDEYNNSHEASRAQKLSEIDELNKTITIIKGQLVEAERELEQELEKIKSPREFIDEENRKLDIRKKDLDIYAARINAKYNQEFGRGIKL